MDAGLNVMLGWDPVATAPGSDSAHAAAQAASVAGRGLNVMLGWDPGEDLSTA